MYGNDMLSERINKRLRVDPRTDRLLDIQRVIQPAPDQRAKRKPDLRRRHDAVTDIFKRQMQSVILRHIRKRVKDRCKTLKLQILCNAVQNDRTVHDIMIRMQPLACAQNKLVCLHCVFPLARVRRKQKRFVLQAHRMDPDYANTGVLRLLRKAIDKHRIVFAVAVEIILRIPDAPLPKQRGTKIGKQIAIAVKAGGPEPDMNPALRAIIANAKRENMPKDNIERAIKNAMGKDQSDYKEVTYEGYGPHGIAIFVDTLTDNTTRTVGDVRSVFNKFNGNLGTQGSLSFLFDHKSVFTFKKKDGLDMDELILDLIDYGVEDEYDEDEEENSITIYGDPQSFGAIQKHLEENGFEVTGAEFTRIPNDLKDVTPEERETIDKMVEKLEDFDDVQTVYTNMKPEAIEE